MNERPRSSRKERDDYDATGRLRGTKVMGGGGWSCTTYDPGGRARIQTFPAWDGQPARTLNIDPAVGGNRGGNPLVTSLVDPVGTVKTIVDLLGRIVSYTDVWPKTTSYVHDQPIVLPDNEPGLRDTSRGPRGRIDTDTDATGEVVRQFWSDDTSAGAPLGTLAATAHYVLGATPRRSVPRRCIGTGPTGTCRPPSTACRRLPTSGTPPAGSWSAPTQPIPASCVMASPAPATRPLTP